MNIFTFITSMAGVGTIVMFVCGVKSMAFQGTSTRQRSPIWVKWHFLFEVTTFATLLAAPLAR